MDIRPGIWPAVGAALLGHGAVLGWLASLTPGAAPQGARGHPPVAFIVRPVAAPAPVPAAPEPLLVATAPSPPVAANPGSLQAAPAVQPRAASAPPTSSAPTPPPEAEAPYLPRGELTVPPQPLGRVDVPFPEDVRGVVDLKVRITLFIDEAGTVQRVRLDSPDLHPSFERAIRDTFAAAKFSPGEVDRTPVRSQMRVEVSFESPSARPQLAPSAGTRPPRS